MPCVVSHGRSETPTSRLLSFHEHLEGLAHRAVTILGVVVEPGDNRACRRLGPLDNDPQLTSTGVAISDAMGRVRASSTA